MMNKQYSLLLLLPCHSRVSPRLSSPAPAGPWRAARAELRRRPPVSPGLRPWVHCLPGHGRMFPAVVRGDPPGTDGVSDQEAASRWGDTLREGTHLPAGKVCGQNPQETLLGKEIQGHSVWRQEAFVCQETQKGLKSKIDSCCKIRPFYCSKTDILSMNHSFPQCTNLSVGVKKLHKERKGNKFDIK